MIYARINVNVDTGVYLFYISLAELNTLSTAML